MHALVSWALVFLAMKALNPLSRQGTEIDACSFSLLLFVEQEGGNTELQGVSSCLQKFVRGTDCNRSLGSELPQLDSQPLAPGLVCWWLSNSITNPLFTGYKFKLISGLITCFNRTLPLECWKSGMKNVLFLFKVTWKIFAGGFILLRRLLSITLFNLFTAKPNKDKSLPP